MNDHTEEPLPGPPPAIYFDRVRLYARLDESVGFLTGHGLHFAGGEELERVPCLAICEAESTGQPMLEFCDSDWTPISVAGFDSVPDAIQQAERLFPGSSACWLEAPFTDEEVEQFLEEQRKDLRCSFCGATSDETGAAIFTGDSEAVICSNCVAEFYAMLEEASPSNE